MNRKQLKMGNKSSKSKNSDRSSDNNNNISNGSKNISKKKRKWFPRFPIKKKENEMARNKIRKSKRKHKDLKKKIEEVTPPQPPRVLDPKPGTSSHAETLRDYEAKVIKNIQQLLVNESGSEIFMLNQLLLSTQFYGNYQR